MHLSDFVRPPSWEMFRRQNRHSSFVPLWNRETSTPPCSREQHATFEPIQHAPAPMDDESECWSRKLVMDRENRCHSLELVNANQKMYGCTYLVRTTKRPEWKNQNYRQNRDSNRNDGSADASAGSTVAAERDEHFVLYHPCTYPASFGRNRGQCCGSQTLPVPLRTPGWCDRLEGQFILSGVASATKHQWGVESLSAPV